jgi:radical SAM superfamily enzyme YgiQ (UPF0313 family)
MPLNLWHWSIRSNKIDFVGLKLWNGDGFVASQIIAECIKKNFPDMPIFAGGPHVDIFLENIYKITDAFDCLVYGEGEETIVMLAEYVAKAVGVSPDRPLLLDKFLEDSRSLIISGQALTLLEEHLPSAPNGFPKPRPTWTGASG